MVTSLVCRFALLTGWIAAESGQAGIQRLDGATRARVLAALAALVILGFGLVLLAWLGARMTRRYMRRFDAARENRSRSPGSNPDDWADRPIVPNPARQPRVREEPESENE